VAAGVLVRVCGTRREPIPGGSAAAVLAADGPANTHQHPDLRI